jgi:hypothetical protein
MTLTENVSSSSSTILPILQKLIILEPLNKWISFAEIESSEKSSLTESAQDCRKFVSIRKELRILDNIASLISVDHKHPINPQIPSRTIQKLQQLTVHSSEHFYEKEFFQPHMI